MKILRIGILNLTLFGLGGCASMSGEECALSDWRTIGFEDGSQGYTADRLGDHRKACAKHGIAPDLRTYQAGRDEGLELFCQPSRGFSLGASGGHYNGVCSADLEPGFLDGYHSGAELYSLRAAVNSATHQIHARESELERSEDLIREKEAALIDSETTTDERIMLLADLKDLSERTGQLEAEIDLLIDDRARHQERLASYQATLAYDGY
ncbi:MAG: DUF2799 domain-containing protein [Gammaproteobacteria bacterium]